MYGLDSAQTAYDIFHDTICSLFNKCFPKICIKPGYKTRKSWLSEELKESIKTKNKLYVRSKKYPTLSNELDYKKMKRYVDNAMKAQEKLHYQELFEKYKNDLKKSWQLIKRLTNKNKSSNVQSIFKYSEKDVTDPLEIVERFNNSFCEYWTIHCGQNSCYRSKFLPIYERELL